LEEGARVTIDAILGRIEEITVRRLSVMREPRQKGDMRDTAADTGAARREPGFRPTLSLGEGLAEEWAGLRRDL
jgi:UDP-glucose 4-epimerase